jgi:23S rRNA (pseudouridine1915-N3)-methyltransferase
VKIAVITVGRTRQKYWQLAEAEFKQRIQRYASLSEIYVRDGSHNHDKRPDLVRRSEGENIISRMPTGYYTFCLDGSGTEFTSEQFAAFLNGRTLHGHSRFAFILGGPLGLADEVIQRSDFTLALSRMTFTHEMARVVLLEQIYRAFTILNNEKYHK